MDGTIRKNGYLDLPAYMWVRLEERAKECKEDLWEYVGEALMDYECHEPNEETKAALAEAMSGQNSNKVYTDVDEMIFDILSEE